MEYKENVLCYENYHRLRASVGWTNFSVTQAKTALANSLYTVIAIESKIPHEFCGSGMRKVIYRENGTSDIC